MNETLLNSNCAKNTKFVKYVSDSKVLCFKTLSYDPDISDQDDIHKIQNTGAIDLEDLIINSETLYSNIVKHLIKQKM